MPSERPDAVDSYEEFLRYFHLDRQAFFQWGISAAIFPPIERVGPAWEDLKKRIYTDQRVYIRGYGRNAHRTHLYQELYRHLFGNAHIAVDPTNNARPQRSIEELTGLARNRDLYNYQVSHIWGHTKNIFLFEAAWNLCYMPKLMDPFTGHEAKGEGPAIFQAMLLAQAWERYRPFLTDYNRILSEEHIPKRIQAYLHTLEGRIPEAELRQFAQDVQREFAPIGSFTKSPR